MASYPGTARHIAVVYLIYHGLVGRIHEDNREQNFAFQAKYVSTESRAPTGLSPDSFGPVTNDPTGKAVGYPYYWAETATD